MRRVVDDIVRQAKRLSIRERRELLKKLADLPRGTPSRHSPRAKRTRGYPFSLAMAGTVESSHRNVSSDKYPHIAAAALHERDED